MKISILTFIILISSISIGQKMIPFVDFNYYFKMFENENFRILEFQQIKEYKAGDEFVAYIDTRGNLRVYDGNERQDISNMNIQYQVSDHLMGYNIGQTLNMWDKGKLSTLTYFAGNYEVKDSIIVYEDTRFNTINVYWNGNKSEVYRMPGELQIPISIGDNLLVYPDNGNNYKVFYHGQSYEVGVWNGSIDFQSGCDVVCFNDPTTRTFVVFDKGEFIEVEAFYVNKYKAGRGFAVYEDRNGNLMCYKNGEKFQISNFSASAWDVKDDIIYWTENGLTYAYQNGNKVKLANFIPKDYLIKNNVVAFRNLMGGVSALIDGKIYEISIQMNAEYEIFGNSVLVKLFNRSFIIFQNGRKFES